MIFAKLRLGPEYAPNAHIMVEILSQSDETPFGRFRVRELKTSKTFDVFEPQLSLCWWDDPNKQTSQNPS
jgi:hypothetical protein